MVVHNTAACAAEPSLEALSPESDFQNTLDRFVALYCDMWRRTSGDTPVLSEDYDRTRQRQNERSTDRLIDDLEKELASFPKTEKERELWRAGIRDALHRFGTDCLGFPKGYLDTLFSKEYVDVTRKFIHQAREFDETLDIDTLFQALRNVWIMNSIQMFLGGKPAFSPSIFAYSMLYPYTDNFLDDPAISQDSKEEANDRLAERLSGTALGPGNSHERDVFRLVGMIEQEFDRREYPDVYSSLLAIHQAQVGSLMLQGVVRSPNLPTVLKISIGKGGASVLADAYLVAGNLERDEAEFFFGYGVFLQLLDDLQDVRQDLRVGHHTIFTLGSKLDSLDQPAARLCQFVERALSSSPRFTSDQFAALKDLVKRNCIFLLLQAIAHNPEFYGKNFQQTMERYSPVRFGYLRRNRKSLNKRYKRIRRNFKEQKNLQSVIEILG